MITRRTRVPALCIKPRNWQFGGASHLFKNSGTRQVATDIDLKGKLTSPDTSTWQAIAQVLRNAFVEAIIPGFDRVVASNGDTDAVKQAQAH